MSDTIKYVTITEGEYKALWRDHDEAATLRKDRGDIEMLLHAAAKRGFVDKHQEDAICFALQKITKQPMEVVKATLHVNPKGYKWPVSS